MFLGAIQDLCATLASLKLAVSCVSRRLLDGTYPQVAARDSSGKIVLSNDLAFGCQRTTCREIEESAIWVFAICAAAASGIRFRKHFG